METTAISSNSAASTQRVPSNTLGKQDFLNLLVTQMRYQDPMDPMKGTEFAAQLAQFSSVEQLTNLNETTLQGVNANAVLTQSINNALSATFIGKGVRAATDNFRYDGTSNVKLGYSLDSGADKVMVKVYNESGQVVKVLNGDTSKGENTLSWDGTNDNGEKVPSGKYRFEVEAKDAAGTAVKLSKYIYGTVNGVRFKSDGTVFVIDGSEVSLSSILEIMEG